MELSNSLFTFVIKSEMMFETKHVIPVFDTESGDDVQSASAAAVRLRDLEARELAPKACYFDNPNQYLYYIASMLFFRYVFEFTLSLPSYRSRLRARATAPAHRRPPTLAYTAHEDKRICIYLLRGRANHMLLHHAASSRHW